MEPLTNHVIIEPMSVRRKQRAVYQPLKRMDEPLFAVLSEEEVLNFVSILQRQQTIVETRRDTILLHQCQT